MISWASHQVALLLCMLCANLRFKGRCDLAIAGKQRSSIIAMYFMSLPELPSWLWQSLSVQPFVLPCHDGTCRDG